MEPICDIRNNVLIKDAVEIAGNVSDMRRRNQVIQLAQRVVLWKRLNIKNIYCRAGDLPLTWPSVRYA